MSSQRLGQSMSRPGRPVRKLTRLNMRSDRPFVKIEPPLSISATFGQECLKPR
jgi:hypothetical protein